MNIPRSFFQRSLHLLSETNSVICQETVDNDAAEAYIPSNLECCNIQLHFQCHANFFANGKSNCPLGRVSVSKDYTFLRRCSFHGIDFRSEIAPTNETTHRSRPDYGRPRIYALGGTPQPNLARNCALLCCRRRVNLAPNFPKSEINRGMDAAAYKKRKHYSKLASAMDV